MLHFDRHNALPIRQGHLLRAAEHFEILQPSEHGPHLHFQVFCNDLAIGQARLEKIKGSPHDQERVVNRLDARQCHTFALTMIQVSQEHRNRGVGSVLLKEVLHYCKNHDVHRVTGVLEVDATPLREWFRRHGFAIVNDSRLEFQLA